mmetsp:Transcript_40399/g.75591  ORF Transcript_40399/g.75591 Transcript_40399/m.75591 type:complete len:615 (+) Transcript_40399:75-1919(+)
MGTFLSTGKNEPGCLGLGRRTPPAGNTSSGGRAMASSSSEHSEDRPRGLHGGQRSLLKRSVSLARTQVAEVIESAGLSGRWLTQLQESCKLLSSVEAQLSANTDPKSRPFAVLASQGSNLENGPAKTVRRVLIDDGKVQEDDDDEEDDDRPAKKGSTSRMGKTYSREVRKWVVKNYTHDDNLEDVSMLHNRNNSADSVDEVSMSRRRSIENAPTMLARLGKNSRVDKLLQKVGQFDFDAPTFCKQPEVAENPVSVIFSYTLHSTGMLANFPDGILSQGFEIDEFQARLHKYMKNVDEAYLDVIYHNRIHAADVMMMMHWLLSSVYMSVFITPFDHLMCLLASSVHDMGHDGVNNLFHVKARSSLALRYSDRSVLESFHAALAFETMRDNPETNWYEMLNPKFQPDTTQKAVDLQQYMRKGITDMILMTDTTKHDQLVATLSENFTGKLKLSSEDTAVASEPSAPRQREDVLRRRSCEIQQATSENKAELMQVLLHAADISNPTRRRETSLYFTRRVLNEFWAQGDEERRLGLELSPLCDRAAGMMSVPSGQIGFATYVVQPLFKDLSLLLNEVSEATRSLDQNLAFWQKLKEENAQYSDIYPDEDETSYRVKAC